MTITAGTRLGAYEILAPIGAGGMGEVYRARDGKLGRDVAVKVLPARLAADGDALARFEREARAVASLSHPNILSIFDFGADDGVAYAVMELLDGETLRQRLGNGALPPRKVLDYGVQIANGLAAAHERGIVHRDLKPENLFVTRDGRIKILDFGLARVDPPPSDQTQSPTVVAPTEPGTVMGTVGYMSPEQVRGQKVDARSDIFSFGSILFEMLSGRSAFKADSAAETMAAIVQKDPPELSGADQPLSPALDRIVRHCLEKSPEERFQSARDLAFDLQSAGTGSGATGSVPAIASGSRSRRRALFASVGTLGLVLAWALGRWTAGHRESSSSPVGRFSMMTDRPGVERSPDISPDGKSFVFVSSTEGKDNIYSQRVGGRNAANLTGGSGAADYAPAFSPDGERIAFRSERDGGGIFVMGATGESVRRVSDFGFDPAWSPDGREIAVASEPIKDPTSRATVSQLWALDAATGKRRLLLEREGVAPRWSPHGYRVAYWSVLDASGKPGGQRDLWTVAADGSQAKTGGVRITDDPDFDWSPEWSPDGRSLYFASDRGGTMNLWRIAVDERSGKPLGSAEPLTTPSTWASHFRFSKDAGLLLFAALDERSTIYRQGFDSVTGTASGAPVPIFEGSRRVSTLEWSPDGAWLVFDSPRGRREDVFLIRADGTEYRQLIDEPFQHRVMRWLPDGTRISFYSNRTGTQDVWTIRPDGSDIKMLAEGISVYRAWAPDGVRLAVGTGNEPLRILDVRQSPFREIRKTDSRLSPWSWSADGQRIAGVLGRADRTTGVGFYDLEPGRETVVDPNGHGPLWLSDSRRLLYERAGGIVLYDSLSGQKKQILPAGTSASSWGMTFSVTKDDRQIAYLQTRREGDIWLMQIRRDTDRKP
jgi:eukaryotic-like serine/threonine-protein kinase